MLNITEHHDSDLSREEIVAVVSLVYSFWPSRDKTIDEVVEAFPESGKRYTVSYPQIRLPSLRYLVWDKDQAVAHALTFERPVTTDAGEFSVWSVCFAELSGTGTWSRDCSPSVWSDPSGRVRCFPLSNHHSGVLRKIGCDLGDEQICEL
jgi:hypothetical protein